MSPNMTPNFPAAKVSPWCQLEALAGPTCRTRSHQPGGCLGISATSKRWLPEGGNKDLSTPRSNFTHNSWSCKTPDEPSWFHPPCETAVLPPEMHMESLSTPAQLCPGCSHCLACTTLLWASPAHITQLEKKVLKFSNIMCYPRSAK